MARRREERETPRRDWPVAALSAAGLAVAGYLGFTKIAGDSAIFCAAGSGCDVVQASRYAIFLGIPTALWGAGLYALVGTLALLGLTKSRWLTAFLLAVTGASFSAYLTYLELFVIRAVCGYCIASAVIAAALFGVLLLRRPAPVGRRSVVRPARVAALGTVTAVATVVLGAGIYAWESPQQAAGYADTLARHLAGSGAIMYGAYW
jgi:uncharacterized membrane protein